MLRVWRTARDRRDFGLLWMTAMDTRTYGATLAVSGFYLALLCWLRWYLVPTFGGGTLAQSGHFS